jgi:hypothetical protein
MRSLLNAGACRPAAAFKAYDFFPGASAFKHKRMTRGNNRAMSSAITHLHKFGVTGRYREDLGGYQFVMPPLLRLTVITRRHAP